MRAHAIVEMTRRSITCVCGRIIRLTDEEAASFSKSVVDNMLLDRHSDHVVSMKEQGRTR